MRVMLAGVVLGAAGVGGFVVGAQSWRTGAVVLAGAAILVGLLVAGLFVAVQLRTTLGLGPAAEYQGIPELR